MKYLLPAIAFTVIFGIGFYLWSSIGGPSHDRNWYDYYERTPGATVGSTTVQLHNVRDWNHSSTSVLDRTWHDNIEVSIADIESVWFGLNRFGTVPIIGHTFLTFETADGLAYTLSIEARREVGEQYNSVKGLFNQYDLWYGWGTERDFVGARLFLLDEPIEYYRLNLTPEEARAVFVAVAKETAAVATEPQYYNTLSANCTNLLAKAINESYPDRIPYHLSWNFPGMSVEFLFEQNLIAPGASVVDVHVDAAKVEASDPALHATILTSPQDFSASLRQQLAADGS